MSKLNLIQINVTDVTYVIRQNMDHSEDRRLTTIFHRKAKPAQGYIAEQGPSSAITGEPVQGHTGAASLCCLIEGERIVFEVPIPADDRDVPKDVSVSKLKELIYNQRSRGTLRDVDQHTLELWKVCALRMRRGVMWLTLPPV